MDCFEGCIEISDSYIQRINSLLNDYKNGNIESDLRTEVLRKLQIQN